MTCHIASNSASEVDERDEPTDCLDVNHGCDGIRSARLYSLDHPPKAASMIGHPGYFHEVMVYALAT